MTEARSSAHAIVTSSIVILDSRSHTTTGKTQLRERGNVLCACLAELQLTVPAGGVGLGGLVAWPLNVASSQLRGRVTRGCWPHVCFP
jgi:hypothetical protein